MSTLRFLAFVATLAGCRVPEETALQRVMRTGILRWGGDLQGGEPYVFEDPARPGQLLGFEVELAGALGRALKVAPVFVQSDWSTLVPALERGAFDIIMNGLEVTPARKDRVRFSRPYAGFSERLVARADDPAIRKLDSLRGRRVGTLANSLAWDMLGPAGVVRVPYEGVEEPFLDLVAGRLDAVLIDDIIVDRYGRGPGLRVVGDVGSGVYAIGMRKTDDQLWGAIDGALGQLVGSGELGAIFGPLESEATVRQ